MHAALVTRFDSPPSYAEVEVPTPHGDTERLVRVVASAIHPRVRSQADGSHYTTGGELPLVPGIDGVCRTEDGELRYFVLPDTTMGAMAEQTVVDLRRSVVLPPDCDPVRIAAAMNPLMSSWVALRRRIELVPDARVVVLGATGSAGSLAVHVARRLGASHVTAVGRDARRLAALDGADAVVVLDGPRTEQELAAAGAQADVVIDYVWGRATADALRAIVPARVDDARRLAWVQVGSVGGLESPIPSAALRATRLELVGSGQGSVSPRAILEELPALAAEIEHGTFALSTRAVPLREVGQAWADSATGRERVVLTA